MGKTGEFFCRITAHTVSTTEGIWWEKGSRVLWDLARDLSSLVPTTERGVCSEDVKRCHEVPGGETGGFQGCREKGPAEHHRTEKITPKPFTSPLPFSQHRHPNFSLTWERLWWCWPFLQLFLHLWQTNPQATGPRAPKIAVDSSQHPSKNLHGLSSSLGQDAHPGCPSVPRSC